MGTILVETGSIWRRIFLLDPVTASEEQKAGLVRVLQSRYHKVCAGELYRIDGQPLRAPTEAITLDTGMVLIGMSECLRSSSEAEKALRDIFMMFFAGLGISREICGKINRAELDLRHQRKMMSVPKLKEVFPMGAEKNQQPRLTEFQERAKQSRDLVQRLYEERRNIPTPAPAGLRDG